MKISTCAAVNWLIEKSEMQKAYHRKYVEIGRSKYGNKPIVKAVESYKEVENTGYFAKRIPDAMVRQILEHAAKVTGEKFAKDWIENGYSFHITTGQYKSTYGQITFTFDMINNPAWSIAEAELESAA